MKPARAMAMAALLAVGAVLGAGQRVAAHTELDFTVPADGTTVGEPVDEITIGFTDPVTLVGNGFQVLDPGGTVLEPFAVTDDDRVFRLQLDPPLAGGQVGVRYRVSADDGHVLEGSFVFDAAAPAATTSAATTAPTTPPASVAASSTAAVASSTIVPPTIPVATTPALVLPTAPDADDSNRDLVIVVAALVAAAAFAFLVVRSHRRG